MSAFRHIKTVTASAATHILRNDQIFSPEYNVYNIQISNLATTTQYSNGRVEVRFLEENGLPLANDMYEHSIKYRRGNDSILHLSGTSSSSGAYIYADTIANKGVAGANFWIFNPWDKDTHTHFIYEAGGGAYYSTGGIHIMQKGGGAIKNKIRLTGISISARDESGNLEADTKISAYGLRRT
tara:strand:- start:3162 stop:3710 length:549 start_codon:yes stop_codon:yes gene_type:complete